MLASLSQSYVLESIKVQVRRWAHQCVVCALRKVGRHTKPLVTPLSVPSKRFDLIHVELVGPCQHMGTIPSSSQLSIVLQDGQRRFPSETRRQKQLRPWSCRTGSQGSEYPRWWPRTGVQIWSAMWKESLAWLDMSTTTTTVCHLQANRIVEWYHSTLKNSLRCIAADNKWVRALPRAMLGIRNAPK